MSKMGEKCTNTGYYKFSRHTDRSRIKCHPSFDEEEIWMLHGSIFPPITTCDKDAFFVYIRAS